MPTYAPGAFASLGDEPHVSARVASKLIDLAARETDVSVRAQLASTARRLPPRAGLDIAWQSARSRPATRAIHIFRSSSGGPSRRMRLADLEDTLTRFTAPEAWRSEMCRSVDSCPFGAPLRCPEEREG